MNKTYKRSLFIRADMGWFPFARKSAFSLTSFSTFMLLLPSSRREGIYSYTLSLTETLYNIIQQVEGEYWYSDSIII